MAAFVGSSALDRISPIDLVTEMLSGASSCKELGDQSFAFFEVCISGGIPFIQKPSESRNLCTNSVTRNVLLTPG